ncbi:HrpF/NolX family T3SS translocon protein [Paucibacter sp. PLA-PC-4]|uniref:HrpF/NolX family T3SS translocon protein n=1 Tax=Paucibacter sp. PLA-PC-4 TaxID=2993655 RepID=UPI00224A9440|nr:HrpF/NolX family T3SS translocon protein [Paucibacter sp. PLA-PC-4]MCX2865589.1 HrpF/NolX family T3SS translocon protein [Paucibacter sp. PLA-PC-4]
MKGAINQPLPCTGPPYARSVTGAIDCRAPATPAGHRSGQSESHIDHLLLTMICSMTQALEKERRTEAETPPARAPVGVAAWAGGDDGLDALATLERHGGLFKKAMNREQLEKMANDPKTAPDVREALHTVLSTPGMFERLESANTGKKDGKLSVHDVRVVAEDPALKTLNKTQAASFADHYIPSSASGSGEDLPAPRTITTEDAQKELYKYAQYLPDDVSLDGLKEIVDGTADGDKMPPQLKAAAHHFTRNPDAWRALNGGQDRVKRADMEDNISSATRLNDVERDTVDRLRQDPTGIFFKNGNLTREKLGKIVSDEKANPLDRQAAQRLLDDPVLFGRLDNGKNGSHIRGIKGAWLKSDDGQIGRGDLDGFERRLKDHAVSATPVAGTSRTPATAAAREAISDMAAGTLDQPEIKKAKGGGLRDFVDGALKVGKVIADTASKVADWLGKTVNVPPFNLVFKAAAVFNKGIAGAADTASTALNNGDVEQAAIKAGIATAGTALDQVTNSSVGSTAAKAAEGAMWAHKNQEKIASKADKVI